MRSIGLQQRQRWFHIQRSNLPQLGDIASVWLQAQYVQNVN